MRPMSRKTRYAIAVAYFVAVTGALIWPVYPALGNHIEPRVLGLPWSLTYVLAFILANALVLLWLYRSEPDAIDDSDRL